MLTREEGNVLSIDASCGGCIEISVECPSGVGKAIAYPDLVGEVQVGDRVLLNVTAVHKSLGTGGYHFVMANLSSPTSGEEQNPLGHIVKLRYTPLQHTVLSVEENASPSRQSIEGFSGLKGMPVVIGQLHSQIAPALAAIKRSQRTARIAYIMTDSAALSLGFSRLVAELREKKLIDQTITVGQAFGGGIEAVNIYTGLIAAREVVGADIAVVCPGPGNTGTGTRFGFSSIEQGEIVNAVSVLGGRPVAIARISFADTRTRHQGISHHTITALETVALCRCTLVLPMIDQVRLMIIQEQIARTEIPQKHKIRVIDPTPGITEMAERNINVTTMGRSYSQDAEFFQSAAAAARYATELLSS
jgi:hypothetical protein